MCSRSGHPGKWLSSNRPFWGSASNLSSSHSWSRPKTPRMSMSFTCSGNLQAISNHIVVTPPPTTAATSKITCEHDFIITISTCTSTHHHFSYPIINNIDLCWGRAHYWGSTTITGTTGAGSTRTSRSSPNRSCSSESSRREISLSSSTIVTSHGRRSTNLGRIRCPTSTL